MAKKWKVMRREGAVKGRDFGVYLASQVVGIKSPILPDEAPCALAGCTADEARRYAAELEAGASVEDVRARRQFYKNLAHSGMN